MYRSYILIALAVVLIASEGSANSVRRKNANLEDSLMLAALKSHGNRHGNRHGNHHKSRRDEPFIFGEKLASGEKLWDHSADASSHGHTGTGRDMISFGDGGFRMGVSKSEPASSAKSINWAPKNDGTRCSPGGYCENETADEDYPAELILERLKSHKNLEALLSFFGSVEGEEVKVSNSVEQYAVRVRTAMKPAMNAKVPLNDVSIRLSPSGQSTSADESVFEDGKPLCGVEERLDFPKNKRNRNNQLMSIVNVQNYTQGVNYVTCRNPGGPCGELASSFPSGSQSKCIQKYAIRHLVALTPESGHIVVDSFAMPSCCVCYVKTNGREGLFGRFAASSLNRNAMTPARRRR